jgi:hypothetical protein
MYLFYGRKAWWFYPPRCYQALYDPLFKECYDERLAARERRQREQGTSGPEAGTAGTYDDRFPLASLVRGEELAGTLRGGELMVFPGGWAHRVETAADSVGFGGGVLNAHRVVDAVRWWLVDRSRGFDGSLDLQALLAHRQAALQAAAVGSAAEQARRARDLERIARALRLCRQWDERAAAPR